MADFASIVGSRAATGSAGRIMPSSIVPLPEKRMERNVIYGPAGTAIRWIPSACEGSPFDGEEGGEGKRGRRGRRGKKKLAAQGSRGTKRVKRISQKIRTRRMLAFYGRSARLADSYTCYPRR
ncbi:hypothetical protein KM043_002819 [Ampulex compressa]|nr:hypothetical protein KM043_002819 [Ampulex compressa]